MEERVFLGQSSIAVTRKKFLLVNRRFIYISRLASDLADWIDIGSSEFLFSASGENEKERRARG